MKPGNFEDISISSILEFVQGVVLPSAKELHKWSFTVEAHKSLQCPSFGIHI